MTPERTEPGVDRRRATAERNVEAILDAAQRILERGRQPSISGVADEAGVSRVTVYAHFDDRKHLLEGVVDRAVRRWVAATERVEPERGPADDALVRLIEIGWEEISRSSHIAEVAAAELGQQAMRRSHASGMDRVRELVERGREDGTFRTDVPAEWLVTAFFALIHGARDSVGDGELDPQSALAALTTTVPDLFRGTRRRER